MNGELPHEGEIIDFIRDKVFDLGEWVCILGFGNDKSVAGSCADPETLTKLMIQDYGARRDELSIGRVNGGSIEIGILGGRGLGRYLKDSQ